MFIMQLTTRQLWGLLSLKSIAKLTLTAMGAGAGPFIEGIILARIGF